MQNMTKSQLKNNQKKAEEKLKLSEQRFRSLIEHNKDGIAISDDEGNYTYVSPSIKKQLGYTPKEFCKMKSIDLMHPDDIVRITPQVENAAKNPGKPITLTLRGKHKNGTWRWFETTLTNLTHDPSVQGFVSNFRDITEQLEAEQKLKESEQSFRNLAETIPQIVWVTTADGYHEYYNSRWYEYTGTSYEKAKGTGWNDHFHPDDQDKAWKAWKHSLKTGSPYEIEYRLKSKTNDYRWFLGRALPILDEKGQIIRWFGTCTDIHDQKEIEKALRRSEEQFLSLVDSNIVGVMRAHLSGEIFDAIQAFLDMIGYRKKDILNGKLRWDTLTPPEYRELDQKAVEDLLNTGRSKPYEKEYICKDGSQVPVIIGASMVDKEKGEVIAFVLDITERKKLEQRKDEFIGIASHELKTPLTSIKGYTQILERIIQEMGDEKLKTYLKKTNTYIDRLNSLISDLLDVSKIQAGKLQMNFSTFNLKAIIKEGIETMQHTNTNHLIKLEGSANITIIGDKHRLEQVFTNLLSNAIKYSPHGKEVIVRLYKKDNEIHVSVQDFGVGIPKEKQSKLFDRFYRVEETAKQFSGLGIGLYISCEIIQRHNGRMWVESEEGKGSTFYFTLPINGT